MYCIKVGERFWVGGRQTSEEYPDAKLLQNMATVRKTAAVLAKEFPNTEITAWKDYGYQDQKVWCLYKF